MTDRKHIDAFNQRLDALLSGEEPDQSFLPEVDRQAMRIASHLADIDLSPQSKQRYAIRRRLLDNDRLQAGASTRWGWRAWLNPSPSLLIAFPGAMLLFVLVFVLGWTFTNLGRLPASGDPVSATAFAIPGTSFEPGLSPSADEPAAQDFAPQPLPTPIASRQSIEYTPATTGPGQTPPLTSPRANSIVATP